MRSLYLVLAYLAVVQARPQAVQPEEAASSSAVSVTATIGTVTAGSNGSSPVADGSSAASSVPSANATASVVDETLPSDTAANGTTTEEAAPSASAVAESSDSPEASSTVSAECTFCTVPAGYTAEQWAAPLDVSDQFSPRFRDAHAKAKEALKDWTVEDKVNLATGVGWMVGRCVGNTKALPDRNWKGLCLEDSPLGVRFADYVSAFPAGINAASTYDTG